MSKNSAVEAANAGEGAVSAINTAAQQFATAQGALNTAKTIAGLLTPAISLGIAATDLSLDDPSSIAEFGTGVLSEMLLSDEGKNIIDIATTIVDAEKTNAESQIDRSGLQNEFPGIALDQALYAIRLKKAQDQLQQDLAKCAKSACTLGGQDAHA